MIFLNCCDFGNTISIVSERAKAVPVRCLSTVYDKMLRQTKKQIIFAKNFRNSSGEDSSKTELENGPRPQRVKLWYDYAY